MAGAGLVAGPVACLFLALVLRNFETGGAAPVAEIEEKYAALVRAAAAAMVDLFDRSTGLAAAGGCTCSHHKCGSLFPGSTCMDVHQDVDPDPEIAQWAAGFLECDPDCGRRRVNMNASVVTTPSDIINEDPNLSPDVLEDICMTQGLEETFKAVHNFSGEFHSSMYFASARSGIMRIWPMHPIYRDERGKCYVYDPRHSVWYKAATSEPKNVVIIVQAGRSMGDQFHFGGGGAAKTRWDVARDTVNGILLTLDQTIDQVNIVSYNSRAVLLGGASLITASPENVKALVAALDDVSPLDGTDGAAAFEAAFDMFQEASERRDLLSSCQNIIIHIGDGEDCASNGGLPCSVGGSGASGDQGSERSAGSGNGRPREGIQKYLEAVEARQRVLEISSSRAAVFTLTMNAADDGLARQLACANGGAWFRLDGRGEPLNNMGAYFQFLAFAMEPELDDSSPPAVFAPLAKDFTSLGLRTNVVQPVFARPKCADGTPSKRKLLLGVIAKEVTLRMLEEEGLGEMQVRNMINRNLARVRACNQGYRYGNCKLQEMRGPLSECPARSWRPSGETKCYAYGGRRYVLETQPAGFEAAQRRCKDMGGRLADPSVDQFNEDLHFLASIAPPDGAWVGLKPGSPWTFLETSNPVSDELAARLWFQEPSISGNCRGGYVDPRGTLRNVGSRLCNDEMVFVCQLDEVAEPEACQRNITPVLSEALWSATAEGCAASGGCTGGAQSIANTASVENVGPEPANVGAARGVICDFGAAKTFNELACCSRDELQGVCQAGDASVMASSQVERKRSKTRTLAIILTTSIALAALAVFILLLHLRHPSVLSWLCAKFIRRRKNVAGGTIGDEENSRGEVYPSWPSALPLQSVTVFDLDAEAYRVPPPVTVETQNRTRIIESEFPSNLREVAVMQGGRQLTGTYFSVSEGVWLEGHRRARKVAIKSLNSTNFSELLKILGEKKAGTDIIERELCVMRGLLRHPNVAWALGGTMGGDYVIVEEWREKTLEALLEVEGPEFSYSDVWNMALGVARAMSHLREHGVTHYYVRPGNVVLGGARGPRLAGFAFSFFKMASAALLAENESVEYIPPECLAACVPMRPGESAGSARAETSGQLGESLDQKMGEEMCEKTIGEGCKKMGESLGEKMGENLQNMGENLGQNMGETGTFAAEKVDVYGFGKVMLKCVTGGLARANSGAEAACPASLWRLICDCTSPDAADRPTCRGVLERLEVMGAEMEDGERRWREGMPKREIWRM